MERAGLPREPLAIVGGTYYERCILPPWDEVYGSGLRAAIALASRAAELTFYTAANQSTADTLESIVAPFKIATRVTPIASNPAFAYLHPLDEPVITSFRRADPQLASEPEIRVQADKVLVFGMLEATTAVEAKMAVYDPQSPSSPSEFRSSRSIVERLAVVANRQEAEALTGRADPNEAGRHLRDTEHAEVVIIKDGPRGALVFAQDGVHRVPAYFTQHVFSIGSGDIFSAVFAFEWMINSAGPVEAASAASLATAWYCQHTNLPLPEPIPTDFHLGPRLYSGDGRKRQVYLAGPFFNLMQHLCIKEVRNCLYAQGLNVFSPFHDVGVTGGMSTIAQADLLGLEKCDLVFAILDGHDPGTVFEIGYARAKGIPVVILVGDKDPVHLTMFQGTGCHVFNDLASAVYAASWVGIRQTDG